VSKTVGTPTAEVLYTFDDANPIDPLSLASLIQVHLLAQPPSPPLPWSFCAAQACGSRPALGVMAASPESCGGGTFTRS